MALSFDAVGESPISDLGAGSVALFSRAALMGRSQTGISFPAYLGARSPSKATMRGASSAATAMGAMARAASRLLAGMAGAAPIAGRIADRSADMAGIAGSTSISAKGKTIATGSALQRTYALLGITALGKSTAQGAPHGLLPMFGRSHVEAKSRGPLINGLVSFLGHAASMVMGRATSGGRVPLQGATLTLSKARSQSITGSLPMFARSLAKAAGGVVPRLILSITMAFGSDSQKARVKASDQS